MAKRGDHEGWGQEAPAPLNIALTTVESRDVLGIEDYRKKSCIPIPYMF
jgi:hypothetical protein